VKIINASTELGNFYELEPVSEVPDCWYYKNETPAFTFHSLLKQSPDGAYFILLTARNLFDKPLGIRAIQFASEQSAKFTKAEKPIVILEGLAPFGKFSFNALAVLSPTAHSALKRESPAIHERTYAVFPINLCEFSGREDASSIIAMRRDYITTVDWSRSPTCKVLARYNNSVRETGTIDDKRVLERQSVVFQEVLALPHVEDSFVELENFRGQVVKVTLSERDIYCVGFLTPASPPRTISKSAIIDFLTEFLSRGS